MRTEIAEILNVPLTEVPDVERLEREEEGGGIAPRNALNCYLSKHHGLLYYELPPEVTGAVVVSLGAVVERGGRARWLVLVNVDDAGVPTPHAWSALDCGCADCSGEWV